jgi:predicted amidohydrolase YtcJ
MPAADLVISETVLTVDELLPTANPRTVPPEEIAELDVRATFLAGQQVYPKGD